MDIPLIVDKIMKHHCAHSNAGLAPCVMIINEQEMYQLRVFVDKYFDSQSTQDIEYFYGVKLIVLKDLQ